MSETKNKYPIAPSRRGKRAVTVYLEPDEWRKLRIVAAKIDKTTTEIVKESLAAYLDQKE